jgi:hypothetical protein
MPTADAFSHPRKTAPANSNASQRPRANLHSPSVADNGIQRRTRRHDACRTKLGDAVQASALTMSLRCWPAGTPAGISQSQSTFHRCWPHGRCVAGLEPATRRVTVFCSTTELSHGAPSRTRTHDLPIKSDALPLSYGRALSHLKAEHATAKRHAPAGTSTNPNLCLQRGAVCTAAVLTKSTGLLCNTSEMLPYRCGQLQMTARNGYRLFLLKHAWLMLGRFDMGYGPNAMSVESYRRSSLPQTSGYRA